MPDQELVVAKSKDLVSKDRAALPTKIVSYERLDDSKISFSAVIDQNRSILMLEPGEEYQDSEFINAEFDDTVKDAVKQYYMIAASSGLFTAAFSTVRLSDLIELKNKLKEKDLEKYVVAAAKLAGYKKNDYKGAVNFILSKAVPFAKGHIPAKLLDYFSDLSRNPRVAGLVFSIITQFTGKKYHLEKSGKITELKVPDYYIFGATAAEKIMYGLMYWFFAVASNYAISKKKEVENIGLPKELLKVLNEFIDIPLLRKVPDNLEDAEKEFSLWVRKQFEDAEIIDIDGNRIAFNLLQMIKNVAVDAIESSFPVLLNECLFRGFYFIKKLSAEMKAKGIASFAELDTIDPHDILPFNNQVVSRMAVIASGTFMAADLTGATIRVLLKKRDKGGKKFLAAMRTEANIAGIGRFVLAIGADSKYWIEDLKVLFVKKQKDGADINIEEIFGENTEAHAVFSTLSLEAIQARMLYCFEAAAVREDIRSTKSLKDKKLKEQWLSEWQDQIVKGLSYQDDDFFAPDLKELFGYLSSQRMSKASHRWIYLMTMELALFKAYQPLGSGSDNEYRKLKFDNKTLESVYLKKQKFVTDKEWKGIKADYSKYYGRISGNTQNAVLGVGISAIIIALSGGLASFFAPQIAVLLAGEAVAGLHGVALTSASLAFVGGGAVAAGGGGMAAGAAIITGGGALLGAAGSGSASLIAFLSQANPGLWARQGAKLTTFCSAVLHDVLKDDVAVESVLTGVIEANESVENMLSDMKADNSDLDKELMKLLQKYQSYLNRTEKQIEKVL